MKLSLNSSPFLSLDKIVIPQHDRATLFKIGLLFIVWSITTFFLSVIRGQKNALAVVLTAAFEKVRELFQFKSDTRIPTSQVDLKSWQSIPLSKIKDLNEDYAMLQFDLPNKSLFDFGIDIGQEVSGVMMKLVIVIQFNFVSIFLLASSMFFGRFWESFGRYDYACSVG